MPITADAVRTLCNLRSDYKGELRFDLSGSSCVMVRGESHYARNLEVVVSHVQRWLRQGGLRQLEISPSRSQRGGYNVRVTIETQRD